MALLNALLLGQASPPPAALPGALLAPPQPVAVVETQALSQAARQPLLLLLQAVLLQGLPLLLLQAVLLQGLPLLLQQAL